MDTPAIETLQQALRQAKARYHRNTDQWRTHVGHAEKFKLAADRDNDDIADLERAINALSYPNDDG